MKKNKKKYSNLSNIIYLFSLQWKFEKKSFLILVFQIPLLILLSILNVKLPQIAVKSVTENELIVDILKPIIITGIIILLINLCLRILNSIKEPLMYKLRNKIYEEKTSKLLYTDYNHFEMSEFRDIQGRADQSLWGSGNGSIVEQTVIASFDLITNILLCIIFGSILFSTNILLVSLLILIPIINHFFVKLAQKFKHKNNTEISRLDRKQNYLVDTANSFTANRDIKIFSMKDFFEKLYLNISKKRLDIEKKYIFRFCASDFVSLTLILIRDFFSYFILIDLVLKGIITIDEFILYFGAVTALSSRFGLIFSKIAIISNGSLLCSDLRDFLEYPESNEKEFEKIDEQETYDLELLNVSYKYETAENNTIDNISLKINKGEKLAIVGNNGAGKTTLIKMICGLYKPTNGTIFMNGIDINNYDIHEYYSKFSSVFQDIYILPISIKDTITCCEDENVDELKLEKCIRLAGLEEKIKSLPNGINTLLNKQYCEEGIDLSGGEKQKLLLARAYYKNAPILILDEPTSALDPIAESDFYNKYKELVKDRTAIFISHRLASTKFCDRIIYLENGKIKEIGTHDELITLNGEYAKMYKVQSQYYKGEEKL